jgi:hypothetical protein
MACLATTASMTSSAAFASVAYLATTAVVASASFLATAAAVAAVASLIIEADPPLSELLDPVIITTFGSSYRAVAFIGAYCPTHGAPLTVDPSLRSSLLFFSRGAVDANDAPALLGGDWEPTWIVGSDTGTCSFPFAGARACACTPLTTSDVCPMDLHASRLITHLLHCDINIV